MTLVHSIAEPELRGVCFEVNKTLTMTGSPNTGLEIQGIKKLEMKAQIDRERERERERERGGGRQRDRQT